MYTTYRSLSSGWFPDVRAQVIRQAAATTTQAFMFLYKCLLKRPRMRHTTLQSYPDNTGILLDAGDYPPLLATFEEDVLNGKKPVPKALMGALFGEDDDEWFIEDPVEKNSKDDVRNNALERQSLHRLNLGRQRCLHRPRPT